MSLFRRIFRARLALAMGAMSLTLPVFAQSSEEVKAVFRDLESTDQAIAEQAEARLRLLWKDLWSGDIRPALPALAESLRDETSLVRRYAALTLAGAAVTNPENAERLQQVAPILIVALADPDPTVRQAVVTAIGAIRPAPPAEAAGALLALLDDPAVDVRPAAFAALARMQPPPPELRQLAVEQLRTRSPLETQAIRLLGGLGTEDPEIVELVTERLASPDLALRIEAVQALAQWGRAASPALPILKQLSADPDEDPTLRALAATVVEQIAGVATADEP